MCEYERDSACAFARERVCVERALKVFCRSKFKFDFECRHLRVESEDTERNGSSN